MAKPSGIVWSDYDTDLSARKNAAYQKALREAGTIPTKGEMVGNRYVAPHWTQQLDAAIGQVMAGNAARDVVSSEEAAKQKADEAYKKWAAGAPTTEEQQTNLPLLAAPGLENEQFATQTVPATRQTRLTHALAGLDIPRAAPLAGKLAEDIMLGEPRREEERVFKAEEAEKTRAGAMEKAKADAEARMDQLRERLASEEKMGYAGNEIRQQIADQQMRIAEMNDATNRERIASAERLANAREEARVAAGGKPIPAPILKDMRTLNMTADNFETSLKGFKPEYAGALGAANAIAGEYSPWASKAQIEAANWRKDYENSVALVERHENFGAALTGPELNAWRTATIGPGMTAETIKHNLETRERLARKVYNYSRDMYSQAGYPQVGEVFKGKEVVEPPTEKTTPSPATTPPTGTPAVAAPPPRPLARAVAASGAAPATGGKGKGRTPVRTGTMNGRKVVQYSDGSTEYAD